MSVTSDYNALDLPAFGSGYLAMIKLYDSETKKYILDILELLTLNAMSYSWITVRAFYYYLARQVEQRRLEWNDIPAIRETAAVSFKHSDMRSAMVNSNRPSPTQQPNSRSNAGEEQPKGCPNGIYRGSCSCEAGASTYASLHVCRVCKSAAYPIQIGCLSYVALSETENANFSTTVTKLSGVSFTSTAAIRPRIGHEYDYRQ